MFGILLSNTLIGLFLSYLLVILTVFCILEKDSEDFNILITIWLIFRILFLLVISTTSLNKILTKGNYYTWTNNQELGDRVWSKLIEFFTILQPLFGSRMLLLIAIMGSDHSPLLLYTSPLINLKNHTSKFEAHWLKPDSFEILLDNVGRFHSSHNPVHDLLGNLGNLTFL